MRRPLAALALLALAAPVCLAQRLTLTPELDLLGNVTPAQRFFIAFGQIWCGSATEQSARVLAKTDPHSSGEWRVKGTVQNFEEFGKAFGCHPGQPMMPASGACRTW